MALYGDRAKQGFQQCYHSLEFLPRSCVFNSTLAFLEDLVSFLLCWNLFYPEVSTAIRQRILKMLRKIHHCTSRSQKLDSNFWTTFLPTKFLFIQPNFQMTFICHCTNSLSSLHISIHNCTFCASLHVKTSPSIGTKSLITCRIIKQVM